MPNRLAGRVATTLVNSTAPTASSRLPLHSICNTCRARRDLTSIIATHRPRHFSSQFSANRPSTDGSGPARQAHRHTRRYASNEQQVDSDKLASKTRTRRGTASEPEGQSVIDRQVSALDRLSKDIEPYAPSPTKNSRSHEALSSLTELFSADMSSSPARDILSSIDPLGHLSKPQAQKLEPAPMRLGPVAGRTIHVDPSKGVDVSRAFARLGSRVAGDSVKTEERKQRFHERPGLKRKRLKSLRWRKRFKVAFKAAVSRTYQLRQMGW